jgi:hypothetical protein
MSDLLALAVEARGGMLRWDEFKALRTASCQSTARSGASRSSRVCSPEPVLVSLDFGRMTFN